MFGRTSNHDLVSVCLKWFFDRSHGTMEGPKFIAGNCKVYVWVWVRMCVSLEKFLTSSFP